MAVGTTSDATMTRNAIVEAAYKKIGVLADGETLSGGLLTDGITGLNNIVRELDVSGKWLWAIAANPSSLTLAASQWAYTSSDSTFPTTMLELVAAHYRDSQAQDWPLQIYTTEQYQNIVNKLDIGDPKAVYLTENITVASKTLFVWPTLASVSSQSSVTGTDSASWKCIRSHTSDSTNRPITGASYLQYWESGGSAATWVTATSYTAPQQIKLRFKRKLFDFDTTSDTPDFPQQWNRLLIYKLAHDLADESSLNLQERAFLDAKAERAYEKIFRTIRPNTTNYRNKASYL